MKYAIGFIGAGNMGGALVKAAVKGIGGENAALAASTPESSREKAKRLGCAYCGSARELAAESEYVVLAVKPFAIRGVIGEIAPALAEGGHVLASVAAGVSIASMRACLDFEQTIIRALPNTPCSIGRGLTLLSVERGDAEKHLARFKELLAASGEFELIPEALMDAGCVAAGCVPAYAYMFIGALARGVERAGLPYDEALRFTALAVRGACELLLNGAGTPEELREAVCSPGGSTIEGVKVLLERGLPEAAEEAAMSAYRRNVELGRN